MSRRSPASALDLAARKFVDTVTKDGGSASITVGDKTVHIGPRPPNPPPVPAADREGGTDDNERPSTGTDQDGALDLQAPAGVKSRNRPGGMNVGRLKSFIERVEKLEEERKAIGGDIRDVYSEAKGVGYDVKTMRKIVALRRMDAADRAEQETLLDVYKHALGMI